MIDPEVKSILEAQSAQIKSLQKQLADLRLQRGPKGDKGDDGADGKVIYVPAPAPEIIERQVPLLKWRFVTDENGITTAEPLQ